MTTSKGNASSVAVRKLRSVAFMKRAPFSPILGIDRRSGSRNHAANVASFRDRDALDARPLPHFVRRTPQGATVGASVRRCDVVMKRETSQIATGVAHERDGGNRAHTVFCA